MKTAKHELCSAVGGVCQCYKQVYYKDVKSGYPSSWRAEEFNTAIQLCEDMIQAYRQKASIQT